MLLVSLYLRLYGKKVAVCSEYQNSNSHSLCMYSYIHLVCMYSYIDNNTHTVHVCDQGVHGSYQV